jgi:hypothetical protein
MWRDPRCPGISRRATDDNTKGRQRYGQPHAKLGFDRSQSRDRTVYGGIGAVDGRKEEDGDSTNDRQDGELKAELSRQYQSTVPNLRCGI